MTQVFEVLGIPVNAIQIPGTVECMEGWIREGSAPRYIAVTGMHGVREAQYDAGVAEALRDAALVVPDGMPLVWLGRRRGHVLPRRVYGPELMAEFCRTTAGKYRHFLYGSSPETLDRLEEVLRVRFGNQVVGRYSPPFRALTPEEEVEVTANINRSGADVVWVGLSTPKQEVWMHRFRSLVRAPVLVGVGAAVDFLAGQKRSAPRWMQENGLEWLFRLLCEPRRLWRRYLLGGSDFVVKVLMEEVRAARGGRLPG